MLSHPLIGFSRAHVQASGQSDFARAALGKHSVFVSALRKKSVYSP